MAKNYEPKALTTTQAFTAMVLYLESVQSRTQSDHLAGLLGDLMRRPDGTTADPAAWDDWMMCVERATRADGAEAMPTR